MSSNVTERRRARRARRGRSASRGRPRRRGPRPSGGWPRRSGTSGAGRTSPSVGDGVDGPLDALARTEQAPRQQRAARSAGRSAALGLSVSGVAAPCGITPTLRRRRRSPRPGGRGRVSVITTTASAASQTRSSTVALVGRRVRGPRCGRRRSTAPTSASSTVEHVVAVGAAVDAVLVLDDRDVGAVEHGDGVGEPAAVRRRARRGPADPPSSARRRRSARRRPCRRWPAGRRRGRRRTWRCRTPSAGSSTGSRTIGRDRRRGGRRGRRG